MARHRAGVHGVFDRAFPPGSPAASSTALGAFVFGLLSAAACLLLAVGMAASIGRTHIASITLYALAAVGAAVTARFPLTFIWFILLVEEYGARSSFATHTPWINKIASGVYKVSRSGVPVVLGLAVCAAIGAILHVRASSSSNLAVSRAVQMLEWFMGFGLAALASIYLLETDRPPSGLVPGVIHALTPWLLVGTAGIVVFCRLLLPGGERELAKSAELAILLKAAIAVLVWVTTGGSEVDGQPGVVFFGPGTPILGIAVIGIWALGFSFQGWRRKSLLLAAALCLVGSFRLTLFLLAALIFFICASLARNREGWKRMGAAAGLAVLTFVLLPESDFKSGTLDRLGSFGALTGVSPGAASSAALHVEDVDVGLQIALRHPLLGLGPDARQPLEMANFYASSLYVHNEYLQQWLTFGIAGLIITVAVVTLLTFLGWSVLRSSGVSILAAGAAVTLLGCAIPLMTAPYLSTTMRYPVILGAAAGVCAWVSPRRIERTRALPSEESGISRGH